MSLTEEQKNQFSNFVKAYRWQLSLTVGVVTGIIAAMITQTWMILFLSSTLAGLIMYSQRTITAVGIGASSVLITDIFFFVILSLSGPTLGVLDLFGGLILGPGFGWLILVIILVVGALIGASGGFIGASLSAIIPWPQWAPEKTE